jgi:retron-type reverse transcriptase
MSLEVLFPATDSPLAIGSVSLHQHSRKIFISHVRKQIHDHLSGSISTSKLAPHLFNWATDAKMLREAWDELSRRGGQAPGQDKRRYTDYDDKGIWSLVTAVSNALRKGNFQRAKIRTKSFLKDPLNPARGNRKISILSIVDRVVQRAVYKVLAPLVDRLFGVADFNVTTHERVFGFRTKRSRLHAVCVADHFARNEHRLYCVTEDIGNAFDVVPLGPLRDVLKLHVPSEELVDVIMKSAGHFKKRGVLQGGPLSPLLLNLYLHHFLDRGWKKEFPDIPLLRYVDDLMLLCRTKNEATKARAALKKMLLPTGMLLKIQPAKSAIRKLEANVPIDWLGFELLFDGARIQAKIPAKVIERLRERLSSAHKFPNSSVRAIAIIKGWLSQMGPCFDSSDTVAVLSEIKHLANAEGFDELPSKKQFRKWWLDGRGRFHAIRDTVVSAFHPTLSTFGEKMVSASLCIDPNVVPFDVL